MSKRYWPGTNLVRQLRGNREDARSLEKTAREFVGYLFGQMHDGQTYITGRRRLPGGRGIMAWVWDDALGKRATVRLFGVGEEPLEIEFWCESGLLQWNALVPFHPLKVHVGDNLKTLPITDELTDGDYFESHFWLTDAPWSEYEDVLNPYYVMTEFWPSFWSGKARLMMQALHAIHRDPREVFGSEMDNEVQGIWTIRPGKYVLVKIDGDGCFVTNLVFPEDAPDKAKEAMNVLLSDTEISEIQRTVAEACVLAQLETSGDPIEVLSAAQVAEIAEASPTGAVAYGWKFARNKLEASIVTFTETCMPEFEEETCIGQFDTSLFTISAQYDFDTNTWSASLSRIYGPIRSRPYSSRTSIYRPLYGYLYEWNYQGVTPGWGENPYPACCYDAIGDTIQPFYCWYDSAERLQITWYVQYQLDQESYPSISLGSCTASFSWSGKGGNYGYRQGGFAVSEEPPDIEDFRDLEHSYYETSYSVLNVNSGGTRSSTAHPTGSDIDFFNSTSIYCSGAELNTYYNDHSPYLFPPNPEGSVGAVEMTAYMGSTSEILTQQQFVANPRLSTLVISAYDAESCYILQREKTETVGDKIQTVLSGDTYPGLGEVFSGAIRFKFISTVGATMWDVTRTDVNRTQNPDNYEFGSWFGYMYNYAAIDDGVVIEEGTTTTTPASYKHYCSTGEHDMGAEGHWSSFFPPSVFGSQSIEGQAIRSLQSYCGDGLHTVSEGDYVVTGGYNATPGLEAFFIGGA